MKIKFIEKLKNLFTHQDLLDSGDDNYLDISTQIAATTQAESSASSTQKPSIPQSIKLEDLEVAQYMKEQTPSALHSSISTKQSYILAHLFDMAYVASTADNGIYLPRPFKSAHGPALAQKYEDLYKKNVKTSDKNYDTNKKVNKLLTVHIDARMQLFERIKLVYPEFCSQFQEKVAPEDYEAYTSSKRSLKKVLFRETTFNGNSDLEETLENTRNDISKVIDSKEFSKACQIEDSFVLSELGIFFDKFAELPPEKQAEFRKQKIQKSKNSKKVDIIDFANKLRDEKVKRLQQYETIQGLYQKLENHPYINLVVPNTPEEQQAIDDDVR